MNYNEQYVVKDNGNIVFTTNTLEKARLYAQGESMTVHSLSEPLPSPRKKVCHVVTPKNNLYRVIITGFNGGVLPGQRYFSVNKHTGMITDAAIVARSNILYNRTHHWVFPAEEFQHEVLTWFNQ